MSKPLSGKRVALLTLLAAQSAAITTNTIYAGVTGFNDTTDVIQTLGAMRGSGFVSSAPGPGNGLVWSITDAGRAALAGEATPAPAAKKTKRCKAASKRASKALSEPGIDPGHTDDPAEEEEETDEEEATTDFALWASGVLQVRVGEDHFCIPPSQVARLRDYLNLHAPRKAPGSFPSAGALGFVLGSLCGIDADPAAIKAAERINKFSPWLAPEASSPPAAPPAPTAAAAAAAPAPVIASANCANSAPSAPPAPAPTEAVGLTGVELDGPEGIRIPGFLRQTAPAMTRQEAFAETAARG